MIKHGVSEPAAGTNQAHEGQSVSTEPEPARDTRWGLQKYAKNKQNQQKMERNKERNQQKQRKKTIKTTTTKKPNKNQTNNN